MPNKQTIKQGIEEIRQGRNLSNDAANRQKDYIRNRHVKGKMSKTLNQNEKDQFAGNRKILGGIVKVVKGIFNSPSWYTYHNTLSKPAINLNRPMDTRSAATTEQGHSNYFPKGGGTHVIQNNIRFVGVFDTDAFKLATAEAFKAIRMALRSNLPYTLTSYQIYVATTFALAVKCKAIERTLGWYNVTRADIPELQEAISCVPQNDFEYGRVGSKSIKLLDDYQISRTKYDQLRSIVKQLAIPKKLMEYASWWVGSVFTDQHAANPQLYFNMLRSVPRYGVDLSTGTLIEVDNWDIATGDIDSVIDEAVSCVSVFGVMNADISKLDEYGIIDLADLDSYTPVTLCDPEFFSVLINSYGNEDTIMKASNADLTANSRKYVFSANEPGGTGPSDPEKTNMIRVDFLEELNDANTVGVMHALGQWADVPVPMMIYSQAAYYSLTGASLTDHNCNITKALSGSSELFIPNNNGASGVWYQIASTIIANSGVQVKASNSTVRLTASLNSPFTTTTMPANFTVTSASTGLNALQRAKYSTTFYKRGFDMTQDASKVLSYMPDGTVGWAVHLTRNLGVYSLALTLKGDTIYTFTSSTDFSVSTGVTDDGYAAYVLSITKSGTATLTLSGSLTWADVYESFASGSVWLSNLCNGVNMNGTVTSQSVVMTIANESALHRFVDDVDYHLPIRYQQFMRVEASAQTDNVSAIIGNTLIKEMYKPAVVFKEDVKSVLYWMYLGLFSVDSVKQNFDK